MGVLDNIEIQEGVNNSDEKDGVNLENGVFWRPESTKRGFQKEKGSFLE